LAIDFIKVTDKSIFDIACQCPFLEVCPESLLRYINFFFSSIAQRMSLNSCTEVGELSLEALMFSCKHIRVLDLSKTALADRVLRALALNYPLVNALYLCDCKAVTDRGVSALAGCQRLGVLRINGCTVRWHVLTV
jgi:hypothetical protein